MQSPVFHQVIFQGDRIRAGAHTFVDTSRLIISNRKKEKVPDWLHLSFQPPRDVVMLTC
jgi:hypothetical protein